MRWLVVPVVAVCFVLLSLKLLSNKSQELQKPTVTEVVNNAVHTLAPKVQAAEARRSVPRKTSTSRKPAAPKRAKRAAVQKVHETVEPKNEKPLTVVPVSDQEHTKKWLPTSADFAIQNREARDVQADCDEFRCPLKDKKTIPVFGVVIRPDEGRQGFSGDLHRGSFIDKTPALYVK